MKRNIKFRGFTLVELLISITVLSVIGLLFFATFSASLRGGNKTQIVLAIKQNGQSLLENMDKTIRGSDNVVCVNSADKKTMVIVKDGVYTRYRFVDPASSSNGQILQDNPSKQIDPATGEEEKNTVFINRVCSLEDPMNNAIVLTDTNTTTGVSIQEGTFTPDKQSGFKDVIIIDFDVAQGVEVGGTSVAIDPVNFKTTIQLR